MPLKCKGQGGAEIEFDLPLSPLIRAQLKNNDLKIIERTGDDAPPEPTESRDEWVNYLERVHGIDVNEMQGVPKKDLIEWSHDLDRDLFK